VGQDVVDELNTARSNAFGDKYPIYLWTLATVVVQQDPDGGIAPR
jgi:hypothetical protein